MKPHIARNHQQRGAALVIALILTMVSLVMLGSVLAWSNTSGVLSERSNEHARSTAVAEAATEKVISQMMADYSKGGEATVLATTSITQYRGTVPSSNENPVFANYVIGDAQGRSGKTQIEYIPPSEFRVLTAQYRGLYGYSTPFRVISNARDSRSRFNITAAVRQDIELVTIPLFQFAIFYNLDLEINPGPVMTVTGPVHSNQTNYLQPQATLTFDSDVTAVGPILMGKKPGDPTSRTPGTIVFKAEHDGGVSTLNLPIGTNNAPVFVREVVEVPPAGEAAASDMGLQRFYNKAKMIVTVTGSGTTVTSGKTVDNAATSVPTAVWDYFLDVGTTFYNAREKKTVNSIQLDVAKFRTWSATNKTILGSPDIVYIVDKRSLGTNEPGVRLINGQMLPNGGLTIATPAPIYVTGDYNTKDSTGTSSGSDTTHTKPAALVGDAVTILSGAWSDANSAKALSSRVANNTTVNAAFLAGIVETTNNSYSGGVENFPRFLEDWDGKSFTYNGSMVVMYPSKYATAAWQGTGATIGIYNPPNRVWAFDPNFRVPAKLPPGTPSVRAMIRSSWAMIKPNSTS